MFALPYTYYVLLIIQFGLLYVMKLILRKKKKIKNSENLLQCSNINAINFSSDTFIQMPFSKNVVPNIYVLV